MIRGYVLVGIMLILSLGIAEARLPQVGDVVEVYSRYSDHTERDEGVVTGFGDGLLCLNDSVGEGCLGINFITGLRYLNNSSSTSF